MPVPYYDAHNHLQDDRLAGDREGIADVLCRLGVKRAVVNGTRPEDWPHVLDLSRRHDFILPSFGVHPWHVSCLGPDWKGKLREHLEAAPSAVGEIGLDRWIKDYDLELQEAVFLFQWRLAVEKNLPVTIHCLKTWGRLFELLRSEDRPAPGFLLHSYGGSVEMVQPLADLGAYFSLSGSVAHPRKTRRREVFQAVPGERLLLETDAPDMPLPDSLSRYSLPQRKDSQPLNHPGNIVAVYEFAAKLRGVSLEELAGQVSRNFARIFMV